MSRKLTVPVPGVTSGTPAPPPDSTETDIPAAASQAVGNTVDAAKYIYGAAPQPIQAVGNWTGRVLSKAVMTPFETLVNAIETPARGIISGLRGLQDYSFDENKARNDLMSKASQDVVEGKAQGIPIQNFPENTPPWTRAIQGMVGDRPEDTWTGWAENEIRKNTPGLSDASVHNAAMIPGAIGSFMGDPAMYMGGLSPTKAGLEAEKAGRPLATLAQQADAGHTALLGMGTTPIIEGKPVLKGMSQIGTGVRDLVKPIVDFTPRFQTDNPVFNHMAETQWLSPQNEATQLANARKPIESKIIDDAAKAQGKDPEVLRQQMGAYMEPPGSQSVPFEPEGGWPDTKGMNKKQLAQLQAQKEAFAADREAKLQSFAANQRQFGDMLPPEAKDLADQYIQERKGFKAQEMDAGKSYDERPYYMPHYYTKDFSDYTKSIFNDAEKTKAGFAPSATDANLPEFKHRGIPLTANEVNNIASQGRLTDIDNFKNYPQLNDFKGKVFDNKIEDVMSRRFLSSAKVKNTSDFVNTVARTFGKPEDVMKAEFAAGKEVPKNWLWTPSKFLPGGGTYLPDDIGRAMTGFNEVTKPNSGVAKAIGNTKAAIATYFYSIYPSSFVTNKVSNSMFRYIHGMYDPMDEFLGAHMTKAMETGKWADKPILNSPVYGPLTDRQVFEMAQKNRGYGMGMAQFEQSGATDPTSLLGKTLGPKGAISKPGNAAFRIAENSDRLAGFITALKRGYNDVGAGMKTREMALDYSALGPTDKALQASAWSPPFYVFARKNLPRMIEQSVKNPGAFATLQKTQDLAGQQVADDKNYMAPWEKQSVPIYMGTNDKGDHMYYYANRIMAQSEINKWLGSGKSIQEMIANSPKQTLDQIVGMTNPLVKLPIELATNWSSFGHKPIERMPGEVTNLMPGVDLPAKETYALKAMRPIKEASALLDSSRPLSARIVKFMTGFEPRPMDVDQAAKFQAIGFKGDINQAKNDVRRYAIQEQAARAKGNEQQAETARKNKEIAIQRIQQVAVENRPVSRRLSVPVPGVNGQENE